MDNIESYESYKPSKIPPRDSFQRTGPPKEIQPANGPSADYFEIEYSPGIIPGITGLGKFVAKAQPLADPLSDPVRLKFSQMRLIAREGFALSKPINANAHNSRIFYRQALFMADFEDDYEEDEAFSQYYPSYQAMSHEQLRTYFTWRAKCRKGIIEETSVSYAFLYIYELLSHIGAEGPVDALSKLVAFWLEYREYDALLDNYLPKWIKHYWIYYGIEGDFTAFVKNNCIDSHYPGLEDEDNSFLGLFYSISKYDIGKSPFITEENKQLASDCVEFTLNRIKTIYSLFCGSNFDEALFSPGRNPNGWAPMGDALFWQWFDQPDRQVVASKEEIYKCVGNRWVFSATIATENSKRLAGYILKQIEVALRKTVGFKRKLTASLDTFFHPAVEMLGQAGFPLEDLINKTVAEFYHEATKTVVTVDEVQLSIIRKDAKATQEKLTVEEEADINDDNAPPKPLTTARDGWEGLETALSAVEKSALAAALQGASSLEGFALASGIMAEVLVDGINEKAMDNIGDSLIDGEFLIYDDYMQQVKDILL